MWQEDDVPVNANHLSRSVKGKKMMADFGDLLGARQLGDGLPAAGGASSLVCEDVVSDMPLGHPQRGRYACIGPVVHSSQASQACR